MLPACGSTDLADNPLDVLVRKLRTRCHIGSDAEVAVLALPYIQRTYEPPAYLIREGQFELARCSFILEGYAFRQKLAVSGLRQIVSLHIPGDFIDLQHLFLRQADHNVQALTKLQTIDIDRRALRELVLAQPSVAEALWVDALVEASIYREWVMNVGRRDAKARIAHLLCELYLRLKSAGIADGRGCALPMTQEQLGDAVGLTSVHVNRMMKLLTAEGAIERGGRYIFFSNWELIRSVADFNSLYLHLDQAEPIEPASAP